MALTVMIRVVPSSGRSLCVLDKNERLRCFLKNPPEKGKANKELCKIIAKACKKPQDCVQIIMGQTSRSKTIKIESDLTYEQLLFALGIEKQTS